MLIRNLSQVYHKHRPQHWKTWPQKAEWWYNTNYHCQPILLPMGTLFNLIVPATITLARDKRALLQLLN